MKMSYQKKISPYPVELIAPRYFGGQQQKLFKKLLQNPLVISVGDYNLYAVIACVLQYISSATNLLVSLIKKIPLIRQQELSVVSCVLH